MNFLSGRYNGIHLLGPSGCQDLAENMVHILKESLETDIGEWKTQKKTGFTPVLTQTTQMITSNRFDVLSNQGN